MDDDLSADELAVQLGVSKTFAQSLRGQEPAPGSDDWVIGFAGDQVFSEGIEVSADQERSGPDVTEA